jgi:hypothetical protein
MLHVEKAALRRVEAEAEFDDAESLDQLTGRSTLDGPKTRVTEGSFPYFAF